MIRHRQLKSSKNKLQKPCLNKENDLKGSFSLFNGYLKGAAFTKKYIAYIKSSSFNDKSFLQKWSET